MEEMENKTQGGSALTQVYVKTDRENGAFY